MIEIGRVCKKLAGRDGNNFCAVINIIDDKYVLIDGNVRRKKCNITHLAETKDKLDIQKGADTNIVLKGLEKLGVKIIKRTGPRQQKQKKQIRMHKKKEKPAKKTPAKSKPAKTEKPKPAENPMPKQEAKPAQKAEPTVKPAEKKA